MSSGILLLEFALLGFIAAVYYLARRNLTAAAAREQAETAESLREVQETVAGLITVLQTEAAAVEERLSERMRQFERQLSALQSAPTALERAPDRQVRQPEAASRHADPPAAPTSESGAIERALRLVAGGESTLSAARQTALTVTEVEMAARMRGIKRNT